MAESTVKVNLDKFDLMEANITKGASAGIRALAFAVQEQAQQNIQDQGAIDTGALRSSIYTETDREDGRIAAISEAKAKAASVGAKSGKPGNPEAIATVGTQISGGLMAKVGVAMEYGLYIEMGTVKMGARPFLFPAANQVGDKAEKIIGGFVAEAVG